MPIALRTLTLDTVAEADISAGDPSRAVNCDAIDVSIGAWQRTYDGVATPFFLLGLWGATSAALYEGKSFDFFCLDDPDGGRVVPSPSGRVLVRLNTGEEHELSAFDLLRDTFEAIVEVAKFLAASGHFDGALMLTRRATERKRPSGPGWPLA